MSVEHFLSHFRRRPVQFTILAKGLLLVSAPLLFQLLLIGVITETGRQERIADHAVAHSQEVHHQAGLTLTLLVEVQTGARGYVLTNNPVFTEPYDRALEQLPKTLETLKTLVRDDPAQSAAAETIANKSTRWLEFQAENVRLVGEGHSDEAAARIATLADLQQMDSLRRDIAALQAELHDLAEARSQLREQNHSNFQGVVTIGTVVAVLLAVLLAIAFTRGISTRLTQVTTNIQSLARGDEFTPPVEGSDEIATVDRSFREMAQTIVQSQEALAKHARMLHSMLENMGDGVVVADETGKFLVFNPAAERILGVGAMAATPREWSERYGAFLADQTTLCPHEQLPLVRAMRGEEVDGAELFVRNAGRSEGTWVTVTARPLKDERGLASGGVAVFQEVTHRKHAEREMQRALRLLDGTRDGIYIVDPTTLRFSYVNQGAIEQVGYSRAELLEMTPLEIKPGFDEPRFREMLVPLLSGAVPSATFTTIHRHKNGLDIPVETNLQFLADSADSGSLVAVVRDITERNHATQQAQDALAYADNIVATLREPFLVLDQNLRVVTANRSFYQNFQVVAEETQGRFVYDLGNRQWDIPKLRTLLEEVLPQNHNIQDFEVEHNFSTVGWKVMLLNAVRIRKPGLDSELILLAIEDITERRRAEDLARDHEARILALNESLEQRVMERTKDLEVERRHSELLLNSAGEGLFGLDLAGRVVFINPAGARTLGYTVEELIGQSMHEKCHHTHADGRPFPRIDCPIYLVMRDGQIHHHLDDVMWRKDGSPVSIEYTSTPLRNEQGKLTGAMVVYRDITERKQAESLLRAKESADAANQAKSEFLASMSHELRTPLNGILGMNELLLNTELTDKQRQFVQACDTSGKALLHQINDILDLSKIEAGKLDLDIHECHLESLVYDIADVFSHSAQQKGYPLHCQLDPTACVAALCDGNRLRQILVNLVGNALKFTSAGGVTIRVACARRDESQLTMRFSVTDSGVGIPADRLDRLFSPFTQVDRSTSRKFGGTGLGLSICKQLVELMGGQIGVESQVGVGSTFWFEVPVTFIPQPVDAPQERRPFAGRRVLAVDGIGRDRKQIGDSLRAWDCPFEQAATLTEALALVADAEAAGTPFDVVLADCRLAAGDEFVLLQKLAKTSRLPVIGLGTDPSDETIAYLHELGVRHVLRDPIRPSSLFNALASVLAVNVARGAGEQEPNEITEEDNAPLAGHLLVAEDNLINQMFIVELLSLCGCTCDVTNNGDEALEALQQRRYDLVLMDCQMPEMDGFTATREIRLREAVSQLNSRLPIIALTANALQGDRELCLQAGMDDYLSKPLNAKQLRAKLANYLPTNASK